MPGCRISFAEYQGRAGQTAVYPGAGTKSIGAIQYLTLGLAGEAGEVANKIKKIVRDCAGEIDKKDRLAIQKELGDVQWYLAVLADELGIELEELALHNLLNLASRKRRGTLHGDGDNR